MKRIPLLLLLLLCIATTATADSVKGMVALANPGCDYFIVGTNNGYVLLEWFGGSIPCVGDMVYGDIESYGIKSLYNITKDAETRVWVDEYWLSKDRVIDRYLGKCR